MKRFTFLLFTLLFFSISCIAQTSSINKNINSYTIMFYNLENLFDTIDDPKTNDKEFLPDGKKMWVGPRYLNKIKNKAKVLASVDSINLPAVIGVSEVENINVLKDLVAAEPIKKGNYQIVHFDSPDPRGIDVALLYRPDVFKFISYYAVPVYYDSIYKKQKTREILYVKGVLANTDTLHLFVNHWKSRAGGIPATEHKRIRYARVHRSIVDSIFNVVPDAKIISMGDFNDEPDDNSVKNHLGALPPANNPENSKLYNLMKPLKDQGKGTHCFRGEWNLLDQIIVSGALLRTNNQICINDEAKIFNPNWLTRIYKNTDKKIPLPTFEGSTYFGGYSDHFAIYTKVILR